MNIKDSYLHGTDGEAVIKTITSLDILNTNLILSYQKANENSEQKTVTLEGFTTKYVPSFENPTLEWDTQVKYASLNGTEYKLKLPSQPDDKKVELQRYIGDGYFPIILGVTALNPNNGYDLSINPVIDKVYQVKGIYANPSSATIYAEMFSGTWDGGVIDVAHGGTGLESIEEGEILIGDDEGNLTTINLDHEVSQSSGNLITSGAVYTAINNAFTTNNAMVYKGTYQALNSSSQSVNTNSTIWKDNPPSLSTTAGWTWIVTGNGYFADIAVEPGDMIIANSTNPGVNKTKYNVIQANLDITKYVTTNTTLTITGAKTFTADVTTFTKTIDVSSAIIGKAAIGTSTYNDILNVAGNTHINGISYLNTTNIEGQATTHDIVPKTTNTYNLGTSSLIWKLIYANEIYDNGKRVITQLSAGNNITITQDTNDKSKYTISATDTTYTAGMGIKIDSTTIQTAVTGKSDDSSYHLVFASSNSTTKTASDLFTSNSKSLTYNPSTGALTAAIFNGSAAKVSNALTVQTAYGSTVTYDGSSVIKISSIQSAYNLVSTTVGDGTIPDALNYNSIRGYRLTGAASDNDLYQLGGNGNLLEISHDTPYGTQIYFPNSKYLGIKVRLKTNTWTSWKRIVMYEDAYWANVKLSLSSSTTTTPIFGKIAINGSISENNVLTVNGTSMFKDSLEFDSTSNPKAGISFNCASYNYINTVVGGKFAFSIGGIAGSNIKAIIDNEAIYTYSNNQLSLGKQNVHFKALYIGDNASSTYGSSSLPIYWSEGVPTACSDVATKTELSNLNLYANLTSKITIQLDTTEWKELYTLSGLSTGRGTYIVQIVTGGYYATGLFTYGDIVSTVAEEIPLHCYGGDTSRIYLATQKGYLMGAARTSGSYTLNLTFKRII